MPESSPTVSLTQQGAIALIKIDNPPVNALSQSVRAGLLDAVTRAEQDNNIKALLIHCEGRTFVAGADVQEFGKPALEPHLPDVLAHIDQCQKPVVAALFGTALGGGFELAMSCHYRVALKGSQVGLPEVKLGLIPGAGGTQLLPRLVGLEKALEITTSGLAIDVSTLLETNALDCVFEGNLLKQAVLFTQELITKSLPPRATSEKSVPAPENAAESMQNWRQKLAKKARGQIAPLYIVDSIENSLTLPFKEGQERERQLFVECRDSSQSKAMRYAFFAEREAAKIPNLPKDLPIQTIHSVGIVGAGTMGGAIAMCFASAGITATLLEVNPENLQKGLEGIKKNYQKTHDRGLINEAQLQAALAAISGTTDYVDLSEVDLVVEAAFENMDVKRDIFRELDKVCKPETILASNTSYLDINEIAASTLRPEQVIGMHFFSPANVMKLLEVVRTDQTNDRTLASVMAVGKRIGKISVAVGHCYGFVGNRMYARYGREANCLLLEGASPAQIDTAMVDWGMAMGPLAVNDMSGIDIGYQARHGNKERFADDPLYFRAADLMVEAGRLGCKTGAGFYRYEGSTKIADPLTKKIIAEEAQRLGIQQRDDFSDEEIQSRLILALVNEGNKILNEGLVSRASDIDVIWLNGYGFPRFRGGPMWGL